MSPEATPRSSDDLDYRRSRLEYPVDREPRQGWVVVASGPMRRSRELRRDDTVGQQQYMWVTFAFVGFGILAFILITM